jgi:hypothetical protein
MSFPKIFLLVIACSLASFCAGWYVDATRSNVALNAQLSMAVRLYGDLKKTFGSIRYDAPDSKNIVDTITIAKDMQIAVYLDGSVKTLRVYE